MSIDNMMSSVEWKEVPQPDTSMDESLPFVTHEGKLNLGGIELDVVQLNTGQRIITEESFNKAFGNPYEGLKGTPLDKIYESEI